MTDDAEALDKGVVAFDDNNDSTTVPVIKNDGSAQIVTIIEAADSPRECEYQLDIAADTAVNLNPDGSISLNGPFGEFRGGIAPAWAKDANGRSAPTPLIQRQCN